MGEPFQPAALQGFAIDLAALLPRALPVHED
jgi:hypothetical protein